MPSAECAKAVPHSTVLEDLAKQLYAVLTDGAPSLRFNISRGCSLRDAKTKKFNTASVVPAGTWRPARDVLPDGSEVDREANPYVLLKHIEGNYDVAIQAPSWSSLVVLDIDLPKDDEYDLGALAEGKRDEVLSQVWQAYKFSAERQPVILRTPGDGYHLYMPICRDQTRRQDQNPWPIAWARQWHEHHLDQHLLTLRPGRLELYPSGVPLRAPCGRGTVLLVPRNPGDPDNLQLEPIGASIRNVFTPDGRTQHVSVRDVPVYVQSFLDRLEAARRPIEDWLSPTPEFPAWEPKKWGPWGSKPKKTGGNSRRRNALYQHIVDSCKPAGGASPAPLPGSRLLYGQEFRQHLVSLSLSGISHPGTRHDSALKLAWYWYVVEGIRDEKAIVNRLSTWLMAHPHMSSTLMAGEGEFLKETIREVRQYVVKRLGLLPSSSDPVRSGGVPEGGVSLRLPSLSPADRDAIKRAVPSEVLEEATAIMMWIASYADKGGVVPQPVNLSSGVLEDVCGQRRVLVDDRKRRATTVAVEALRSSGILTIHTDYSVGFHSRRFAVWYKFRSGVLPRREGEEVVLGERKVEEGTLVVVANANAKEASGKICGVSENVIELPDAWWKKMYERRAYTPADLDEERQVLPGPFRDKRKPIREVPSSRTAVANAPIPETVHGVAARAPATVLVSVPCPAQIANDSAEEKRTEKIAVAEASREAPAADLEVLAQADPRACMPESLHASIMMAWKSWEKYRGGG